jgi:hypothetical protein
MNDDSLRHYTWSINLIEWLLRWLLLLYEILKKNTNILALEKQDQEKSTAPTEGLETTPWYSASASRFLNLLSLARYVNS